MRSLLSKQQRPKKSHPKNKLSGKPASANFFSPAVQQYDVFNHFDNTALRHSNKAILPESARFFAPKLSMALNNVRIHDDNDAAISADRFNARAFTYNNHIFFNKNEYQPHTFEGKKLLAHELAHVKQNRPVIARKPKEEKKSAQEIAAEKAAGEARRKKIAEGFQAQKLFWTDLKEAYPNDGRKIAGTSVNETIDYLNTSFKEGEEKSGDITISHSAPIIEVGKKYLAEPDKAVRQAAIKAELDKIDPWRFDTFRIDDLDLDNTFITGKISGLSYEKKVEYIEKLTEKSKHIVNGNVQEYIRKLMPSTPKGAGATMTASGGFTYQFGNISIEVLPDVFDSAEVDENGGKTKLTPVSGNTFPGSPAYTWNAEQVINTTGTLPAPVFPVWNVQTVYGKKASPGGSSGYGYGTRQSDKDDKTTSLRFHEGSHGQVFIDHIRANFATNPYPVFTGKKGDTKTQFESKLAVWVAARDAFSKMIADANNIALHEVDCAGKSIVTYYTEKGKVSEVTCP